MFIVLSSSKMFEQKGGYGRFLSFYAQGIDDCKRFIDKGFENYNGVDQNKFLCILLWFLFALL
jgi:hypothetical protein